MVQNRIIFFATSVQPNPEEIDYWVDLSDNPYGGSIKYFNGTEWVRLAASGGMPDLSNYYTKTQINNLLNNKADVGDVDSKVDDEEVKDVIKDIQFNTSNPNGITMVMFKYDGSNKTVSIPVASTSSAGIITSKDFLDFVKQHQLQELHTEMIDTFADIRAKYQKKLIAGLNIEIDQETNVISASGDLAVQWNNITGKPDFKPVATSGDYNDLINKLKPGKDVSISEDNVISIAIDSDSLEQSLATLQSNIDKEAATARAAEQTISTNLQNEIDRSTQIDTQHTNAINKEVQDRKEAIATEVSDRNAAILVETNRAKAKEEELDNKITDHTAAIEGSIQEVADDLASEVTRATGVEETLNSNITQLQAQKVDKVEGKGLSTNDYTTPEKNKLAAIEAEANKYVLPAATASALGGVKIGSNITLADGGTISITKANVTSALGVDPTTTYVKKAGDTMTGTLTSASTTGSIVFKGVENSDITNIYKSGGNLSEGFGMHANADIINGLRFNWYDTFWYIGNIRGSGTESYGFGIVDNNDQIGFRVTTDAVYANKYTSSVSTGNAPISVKSTTMCPNLNADMVDGKNADAFSEKNGSQIQITTSSNIYVKLYTITSTSGNFSSYVQFVIGGRSNSKLCTVKVNLQQGNDTNFDQVLIYYDNVYTGGKIRGYLTNPSTIEIWYIGYQQDNIYVATSNTFTHGVSVFKNMEIASNLPTSTRIIAQYDAPEDWYGVSWSETSSNPDCTRIGNMEMHRSLPIQSMMKPFAFNCGQPHFKDQYVPVKENFTSGQYSHNVNDSLSQATNDVNIMIKIPEFWYTDDYNFNTKTHNLKICQHAKSGWNHHKEAYVSAYELYNLNGRAISKRENIPTVNFTRANGRTWARANGFDGEAKWNLYTYEEHRAICHLFLVEYATRNSQKAVNTTLTVEGFRQGGLGSGCTTGTATINGATTYSFIPTGSSDSLGSGSGEVTVTIQQTDSSGHNTSTITRKCNRYRGIENPFGHIWKYTDDVISVYNGGYRTWYKSIKPNQFADNKNVSYKPLTTAVVVAGYKTEIRATPTCDFFAAACTNGSETTYWCDYNWDNTDASEHCLLISGSSGDGGRAGLFALTSHGAVGYSATDIGSRLTYLPWAE